jgi:hypothetical protein
MVINKTAIATSWCEHHRKLSYISRKVARRVARRHPEHKSPYRCTEQPELWHIGALHPLVLQGIKGRGQTKKRAA